MVKHRFNTSHVTLYPYKRRVRCKQNPFQYISCYSLSRDCSCNCITLIVSIHLMLLFIIVLLFKVKFSTSFQYISCYSLSRTFRHTVLPWFRFNTSHVTLYPNTDSHRSFRESSFNTSHVTLYLKAPLSAENAIPFQYISCYSLSSRKT